MLKIEVTEAEAVAIMDAFDSTGKIVNFGFYPGRIWLQCEEGSEQHQALLKVRETTGRGQRNAD